MRLSRKLDRWMQAALLTEEQRRRILEFEDETRNSARWLVWSLAAVGGLAIAAGIVSLIAANWQEIPAAVKLFAGVGLLAATAVAALRFDDRAEGWPRDLLLLVHQLLVLAVIGLVAQVYHLSGAPWRPFALASALALPPVLLASRSVLTDVWIAYSLTAVALVLDRFGLWKPLFNDDAGILPVAASVGLLLLTAGRVRSKWLSGASTVALGRWAAVLLCLTVTLAAAASSIWELGYGNRSSFSWPWGLLGVSTALALAATSWWRDPLKLGAAALGILLIAGPALATTVPAGHQKWLGFVIAVAFCLMVVFAAAHEGSRRWVNLGSLLLTFRIVRLFFELFENLTRTGLGLLLCGVVLLGAAFAWWRLRILVPVAPPTAPDGGAP